jgi:hypothetical protein
MSVQVLRVAGERWILTLRMPPPSEAVASSEIVPRRFAPGSVSDTVGTTLSMRRFATVELLVSATLSVATARKS